MDTIHDQAERSSADEIEMSLPDNATAPGQARNAVRATLTEWRLPAIVDSCVLAVSELTTNALKYGRPPVALSMRRGLGGVRIDVRDARPQPVETAGRSTHSRLTEGGRGLDIVRVVADDLGSDHIPGDGKNVYATWNIDTEPHPPGSPVLSNHA